MAKLHSKVKKVFSYFKLATKSRGGVGGDSIEKIYRFHSEFNAMGLGADFKRNELAGTSPVAMFGGKEYLMFASNNYLGLSTNPNVIKESEIYLKKHGLGPGGSRFLCGNIDVLEDLDKKTAMLVGSEDAITFPTGYMANLAIFQAIMDPLVGSLPFSKGSGIIFSDEFNHGSIIDGCRLSYSKKITFRHNDLEDLSRKLEEHASNNHKMIVTEGVFTPHGDISPLPDIINLAKNHNAILMVDDAHGLGVMGDKGGGTTEYFNIQGQVDILMGSYDKALGSMGGFIAGKKKLIDYLRIASRPYVFSSSIPGVLAGGTIKAIDECINNKQSRKTLFENAKYIRDGLKRMGYKILGSDLVPVVLVYIGDENKSIVFANNIYNDGVYCPSFRWPAVPQGESRIRITPMTTHTKEHMSRLLNVFESVGRKMNII